MRAWSHWPTLVGIVLLAVHIVRGNDDSESAHFPYSVRVTGRGTVRLVLAIAVWWSTIGACVCLSPSNSAERIQGLRAVTDLGAYDGMLFVFPSDAFARFTMAQTPLPLDIGWYTSDRAPVDRGR